MKVLPFISDVVTHLLYGIDVFKCQIRPNEKPESFKCEGEKILFRLTEYIAPVLTPVKYIVKSSL